MLILLYIYFVTVVLPELTATTIAILSGVLYLGIIAVAIAALFSAFGGSTRNGDHPMDRVSRSIFGVLSNLVIAIVRTLWRLVIALFNVVRRAIIRLYRLLNRTFVNRGMSSTLSSFISGFICAVVVAIII